MPVKATDKVFSLRLPATMYEKLEKEAKKNKRSVNTEILIAIEDRVELLECPVGQHKGR